MNCYDILCHIIPWLCSYPSLAKKLRKSGNMFCVTRPSWSRESATASCDIGRPAVGSYLRLLYGWLVVYRSLFV